MVFRSFAFSGERSVDRSSLTRSFGHPFGRLDVRSLGLPFVRSFAFLVCLVVPSFAVLFAIHRHKHDIKNNI